MTWGTISSPRISSSTVSNETNEGSISIFSPSIFSRMLSSLGAASSSAERALSASPTALALALNLGPNALKSGFTTSRCCLIG